MDTTPRQISRYEVGDVVPRALEILVDIALVLGVSIDEMLSPAWIEARRARLTARLNTHRAIRAGPIDTPRYLAIAAYAGHIVVTLVTPLTLIPLGRFRARNTVSSSVATRVSELVYTVLTHEPLDALIIEPMSPILAHLEYLGIPIQQVTLTEAKRKLLNERTTSTNADLYRFVMAAHPALRPLMTRADGALDPGTIPLTNRWQMLSLHPIILALAVLKREHPIIFHLHIHP